MRIAKYKNTADARSERTVGSGPARREIVYDGPGPFRISTHQSKKRGSALQAARRVCALTRFYLRNRGADVLMTERSIDAIMLAAVALLAMDRRSVIIADSFNLPRSRGGLASAVLGVAIRRISTIYVHSKADIGNVSTLYRVPEQRVRFRPYSMKPEDLPVVQETDRSGVVAIGGNGRDIATMLASQPRLGTGLSVICRPYNLQGLAVPEGVEVLTNIPQDDCFRRLAASEVSALPLDGSEPSCGQITLIASMLLGTPIVATDLPAVQDYIEHGETGLLVPIGDAENLAAAVNTLHDDPELWARIASNAREWATRHAFFGSEDELVAELVARALPGEAP